MSNLVIVAIPDENDRVWKISSEKVPHLTVLFLGDNTDDVANVAKITDFVEHAATTTLKRFYLPVDRRGVLGVDEADVLFFKKGRYDFKAIRDFRATLLQDNNIKTAYDSAPQFEGPWQPHLTLGYPATPANEDPQDYPFYEVSFNRIAVWTGDYEGTEFLLKDYWDEIDEAFDSVPMDVAMSDIVEHHGVKGMRWGVRKGNASQRLNALVENASTQVKDQAFEAHTSSNELGNQLQGDLHKAAHAKLKSEDLPKINAKPEYVKAARLKNRLLNPRDATTRQYRSEVKSAYIGRLEEAANSRKNASGTRQYTIRERGNDLPAEGGDLPKSKYQWEVTTRAVKHASTTSSNTYTLEVILDANGFITDLTPVANVDVVAQTADLGAEFLSHYGVKGMRWGVRKDEGPPTSMFDPQGHNKTTDIVKTVLWPAVPPLGLFAIPAQVRLARAAGRGAKAKAIDINEKRFAAHAHSAKNFADIHNAAGPRIDSLIPALNARHSGDLTKDPAKQKAYDDDVVKTLRGAYRESANSIGNKPNTMHLDVEFQNDGMDFKITAKQGAATPIPQRVQHAASDETVELEYTGTVLRDNTGHFKGLKFNDPSKDPTVQHTTDLGAEFLSHYGVKGMRWGMHRQTERSTPTPKAPSATSVVPHGDKRKTKIEATGGENHPAHEDAIKVAEAKAKLQKSGPAALSNQELRDVATRVQLEQQVTQLTASKGKKFATNLIKTQGQQELNAQFNVNRQNRLRKTAA